MERHMEYMKRRLKEEADKCALMNPFNAARRIQELEKRLDELEGALRAERTVEVDPNR